MTTALVPAGTNASVVSDLGGLLQYGVPGLALAVMLVAFFSLHSLQRRALDGTVKPEQVEPFVKLQRWYLLAAVIVFCVSTVAPRYFKEPINATHRVAFSVNPVEFDDEKLIPSLVVAGGGTEVPLKRGTGEDTFSGERTYVFSVEPLAKDRDFWKRYVEKYQLLNGAEGKEGTHGPQSNR